MSAVVGLGLSINTLAEFNRRADRALRAIVFRSPVDANFAACVLHFFNNDRQLPDEKQQQLFNLIHRLRRQVTDQLLTEYAALKAKGADA
jgi:hypothetical protein